MVCVRGVVVCVRGVVRGVVARVMSRRGDRLVRGVVARVVSQHGGVVGMAWEVVFAVATSLSIDRAACGGACGGACVVTPRGASPCVVTRCDE